MERREERNAHNEEVCPQKSSGREFSNRAGVENGLEDCERRRKNPSYKGSQWENWSDIREHQAEEF